MSDSCDLLCQYFYLSLLLRYDFITERHLEAGGVQLLKGADWGAKIATRTTRTEQVRVDVQTTAVRTAVCGLYAATVRVQCAAVLYAAMRCCCCSAVTDLSP